MPWSEAELLAKGYGPNGQRLDGVDGMDPEPPKGGTTSAVIDGEVAKLHEPFKQWLKFRGIVPIYSRPDRATGQRPGIPDFCLVAAGRPLGIEFKVTRGRVSKAQQACHVAMRANGWEIHICRDLMEARDIVAAALADGRTEGNQFL